MKAFFARLCGHAFVARSDVHAGGSTLQVRSYHRVAYSLTLLWLCAADVAGQIVPALKIIQGYSMSNAPSAQIAANRDGDARAVDPSAHLIAATLQAAAASFTTHSATDLVASEPPKTRLQNEAMAKLRDKVGGEIQIHLRPGNLTPRQIRGALLQQGPFAVTKSVNEFAERKARAFFRENKELLRLDDPDTELKLTQKAKDDLGRQRLRFAQYYKSIEMWPAELSVHLDSIGNVDLLDGAFVPTPTAVSVDPVISSEEALSLAQSAVAGGFGGDATGGGLIIYAPLDRPARLAWKLELMIGLTHAWLFVIDASDGTILKRVNQCSCAAAAGSGIDQIGIQRTLHVSMTNAVFYLVDRSKPMYDANTGAGTITILDAENETISQLAAQNRLLNLPVVSSSDPNSWANSSAVSAAFNLSEAHDYYRERFGRNSYNDLGGTITAIIRIRDYPSGASWHPILKTLQVGNLDRYPAALDVLGHEFTHSVVGSVGEGGVLDPENQPGALNEAWADIFGEMIEARTGGRTDWLMGTKLSQPIRNLKNPGFALFFDGTKKYPSKMSEYWDLPNTLEGDQGGVHLNSTIISRAYYLLAEGLQGAIGLRDAERIFFRCLFQHLARQSQFIDARLGCVASAEEIFGVQSVQALKTAEAFDAVELFSAPASVISEGAKVPVVAGSDATLFIYSDPETGGLSLGRREGALADSTQGTRLTTDIQMGRVSVAGNGSLGAYVNNAEGFCFIGTSVNFETCELPGQVYAVALSPDTNRFAVVMKEGGKPLNEIRILDFRGGPAIRIPLVTPVIDGPPLDNVSYANSLDFSPDGNLIIYDALSKVPQPDGSAQDLWGLYVYDLRSRTMKIVVPPIEGLRYANPSFSQTTDRFITFDAQQSNGDSGIFTMDLTTGKRALIRTAEGGFGYPCFTGNDLALVYSDRDVNTASGRTLFRQALSADRLSAAGSRSTWLRDALLGVVYRRGRYVGSNAPPEVSILTPRNGDIFQSLAAIPIEAAASDRDGAVVKVEFYQDSLLLGEITAVPFSFVWTNVPTGNYRLVARATDSLGGVNTSKPIQVAVHSEKLAGIFTGRPGQFQFSLDVLRSGLFRIEASHDLSTWTPLATAQSINGFVNFTDANATNFPRRFYRVIKTP